MELPSYDVDNTPPDQEYLWKAHLRLREIQASIIDNPIFLDYHAEQINEAWQEISNTTVTQPVGITGQAHIYSQHRGYDMAALTTETEQGVFIGAVTGVTIETLYNDDSATPTIGYIIEESAEEQAYPRNLFLPVDTCSPYVIDQILASNTSESTLSATIQDMIEDCLDQSPAADTSDCDDVIINPAKLLELHDNLVSTGEEELIQIFIDQLNATLPLTDYTCTYKTQPGENTPYTTTGFTLAINHFASDPIEGLSLVRYVKDTHGNEISTNHYPINQNVKIIKLTKT